jgi:xanthine dehydrogenase accessory factor
VKQALKTRAGYIGLIGSLRKRNALFAELAVEGFSNDDLPRVYCPTGMSILAETPEEIAVSIVAQLVFIRARKTHARKKSSTLYVETSIQLMSQPEADGEGIRAIR